MRYFSAQIRRNLDLEYSTAPRPYVAMTFDDGPSAELTPRLLDMLKARHIKAKAKSDKSICLSALTWIALS